MQWNINFCSGLGFLDHQGIIPDMLPPHPHNISTPLPRVKQQVKGQSGLRSDRVLLIILLNFYFRPRPIAR